MARAKLLTDEALWRPIEETPAIGSAGGSGAAEEIADQVQEMIVSGRLEAGARLPSERDLARMLATSRPTVSQAIRILVVKGLVHTRRGSGAYVMRRPQEGFTASVNLMLSLDRESAAQLNELRLWLETAGVTEAIERATLDEVDAGKAALDQLLSSTGDIAAWMSADTSFHATVVRASHNPFLASIYESVHANLIRYEHRGWIDRGAVPDWLQQIDAAEITAIHEPILAAIRDRDVEAGRLAVLRHHEAMEQHLCASHE